MALQQLADARQQARLVQLRAGQVDREGAEDVAVVLPFLQLAAGFRQHPVAQRQDQPALFGHRDEAIRRDVAEHRVRPAHQRFGAHQGLAAQAVLGLVEQAQFVALQGAAQLLLHGHAFVDLEGQRAGVELAAVAALGLGLVHGRVGVLDQRGDIDAVLRIEADADAGADEELVVIQGEGRAETFQQFLRNLLGVLLLVQAGQQDDELVAA